MGAGDAYLVEAVNSQAEVYGKDGSAKVLLNTAACTTNPSNDTISDPRLLYDATDGRWFISTMTFSPIGDASWNPLISSGSDPTAATWECLIIPTSNIRNPDGSIGNFPDFPKIGMNSDKVAVPVMAAAADVERCSGLAGLWRDIARARDKGVSADVLRAKVDATKDTSADAKAKMDGAVTMIYGHPEFTPDQVAAAVLESCLGE